MKLNEVVELISDIKNNTADLNIYGKTASSEHNKVFLKFPG